MPPFDGPRRLPHEHNRPKPPKNLRDVPRFLKELFGGFFKRFFYILKLVWNTGHWIPILLVHFPNQQTLAFHAADRLRSGLGTDVQTLCDLLLSQAVLLGQKIQNMAKTTVLSPMFPGFFFGSATGAMGYPDQASHNDMFQHFYTLQAK